MDSSAPDLGEMNQFPGMFTTAKNLGVCLAPEKVFASKIFANTNAHINTNTH